MVGASGQKTGQAGERFLLLLCRLSELKQKNQWRGVRPMAETNLRVLVVDDERQIRRFLRASLSAHGFEVLEAATGQEGLLVVVKDRPDVLILDLGLPDMDGVEVIHNLREWSRIPILVLSVRDHETDKISALDAGADDFLTKPFGVGELMARMRVAFRHIPSINDEPIIYTGELTVDFNRRQVMARGKTLDLTPTEYDLLRALIQSRGRVLTHRQLLKQVWGPGYEAESHLLRVNISNLRQKIELDPTQPQFIVTEPGVGYRFNDLE
jgi:two-component system, OmpR family, KDP operon response regulator KdpE